LKEDELGVNWEFLDEVPRTKALRRINFLLEKERLEGGGVLHSSIPTSNETRAKVHQAHMRTSSLPPAFNQMEEVDASNTFAAT
jgi:hypothetical protein